MQLNQPSKPILTEERVVKIEVITGESVLQLLSDNSFLLSWSSLYQSCPWATVFQSHEYVSVWYQIYHQQHLPIVIKEETGGRLTGLLTLAKDVKELGITAAGGWSAYYHTWLVADYDDNGFIKKALTLVRQKFPGQKITFKYIPPQTPLGWLDGGYWSRRHVIRPFLRPVMDFTAPNVGKLFSKKQFREGRNRLSRVGNLTYEQITDYDAFVSVLDELADQYDFRKAVTLNKTPFRKNLQKKEFLLALYRQNILHVAVLRVNGHIAASLVATEGKNRWVHGAGINTHSPLYGKYSPGYLIMVMLGQHLYGKGYQAFDLTPGGHEYKERLANTHDQLYELCITSQWDALSTKLYYDYLKEGSKALFSGAGINLKYVKRSIDKKVKLGKEKLKLARHGSIGALAERGSVEEGSGGKSIVFKIDPVKSDATDGAPVKVNSLCDLLDFDADGGSITRWEFMKESVQRFENGEQAYTLVKDGRLAACVWRHPEMKHAEKDSACLHHGAVMLDGIYCHADAHKALPTFLAAVATQLPGDGSHLYLRVSDTDKTICTALDKAGFATESVLHNN
ncbi:GNAT family N-acetyltransferase [Pontibacter chinhatensis]|uniref:Acetyltransferase involved in cellulose biosynthesis, CelD/BcsL family n=1 Tax=Pontibacter chinhatensis TaxID=1436961 RepID=A0A1I2UCY2_9BACT|nr:GNAT family N-acetyltransferase [Pontibacter chinhatensis]SFG74930.1 Acetyltransferase involved in cellulose biosynthesis, CelD/BcsL family [Pontibacter chinhatensis]